MDLILNNRIRISNPPEILKELLINRLRFINPKWSEAQEAGRSTWGINQYILNFMVLPNGDYLLPRGILYWLKNTLNELNIKFNIINEHSRFNYRIFDSSKIKYRPYQAKAVSNLISTASEGVLVSPAGSGKTIMGLSIIPIVGQPTLWLTHTGPLAEQAKKRAQDFLPDIGNIGLIGDSKWNIGENLTIGMIQTLVRNPEKLIKIKNDFGLVIVDEAHHTSSRTFTEVVTNLNPYYLYGLTATPYRRDKLEPLMFQALGEIKTVIPIEEVAKHGGIILPKVKYRTVNSKKIDGNNIQDILKIIIDNKARNHMIVSDVIKEAVEGHYCIVISDRREHCEVLKDLISIGWEKTGIATGKYSKKYVKEQVDAYNSGDITVLVATFALLGEGFDVPFLDRAFITMPFRAQAKAEQLIGRIQRFHEGKKDAIVFDYVDVDIGVLENQFYSKSKDCRYNTYIRLGVPVEPY